MQAEVAYTKQPPSASCQGVLEGGGGVNPPRLYPLARAQSRPYFFLFFFLAFRDVRYSSTTQGASAAPRMTSHCSSASLRVGPTTGQRRPASWSYSVTS